MTEVVKEVLIEARREQVWRHLEDPDLLAGWLMRNDFRPEVGRAFRFYKEPAGTWDGVVRCVLTEFDPPRRMAFTWNTTNLETDTRVVIELEQEGGGTRLRLVHSGFEDSAADVTEMIRSHTEGWEDHVGVLLVQTEEEVGGRPGPPGEIDWTAFELHVAVDAPPEKVLAAWATARGMESFFVEMMRITGPDGVERDPDEPAAAGDRFIWRWHNGRTVRGRYLGVTPGEVGFSFVESDVSVRAVPYRGGSLVRLRQYGIPDTEEARMHVHANCRGGWVYFLTVLKGLLEEGVDVRDPTRATGASFSTYFDPRALGIGFGGGKDG